MKRQPETVCDFSRLALGLLVVWLAAVSFGPRASRAQVVDGPPVGEEEVMVSSPVEGGYYDQGLDVFFRLHHHIQNYGEPAGKTGFGVTKYFVRENSALFLDAAYRLDNNVHDSTSAGLGLRTLRPGWFSEAPRIYGANLWYDGDHSDQENYFNQLGVGLESLGEKWDLRANAYFPLGERTQAGKRVLGGRDSVAYTEGHLTQGLNVLTDVGMTAFDAELAYHLWQRDWYNLWVFGGAYHLDGDGEQTGGFKTGLRGYVSTDLSMQLTFTRDDIFGTTVVFGFNWFFNPSTVTGTSMSPMCIVDRLREPVRRNDYVVVTQKWVEGTQRLTDPDGNDLLFVHVDSGATGAGDGTIESPFSTLAQAQANSNRGDIIFVHSNSVFNGESLALRQYQRLLGEGVPGGHTVATAELGDVRLPESSPGAGSGAVPIIQNAPGGAVSLANNNEISGLTIDGGTRGIVGGGTEHQDINVNRSTIRNTTGSGVEVNSNGSLTFDELTFDNVGGDDLVLHEQGSTTATISNVTSNDAQGIGLNIENAAGTVEIDGYAYDGGATGAGGILFTSPTGSLNVSNSAINNGAGFGVRIFDSDGTHTFSDTTITNPSGAAFNIEGGTANVSFTGRITQGSNAAAVAVSGEHDGTIIFEEATEGQGVIAATNGTGLQFDNADGTYAFFDAVTLGGGDAGIDVLNDSQGLFHFSDATITDPSGPAFNLEGGTANVSFTGKITQGNNAAAVAVSGGHTGGTVTFQEAIEDQGVIAATNGTGLQFDDADGAYQFNHAVTLGGGDAGIDVLNDSAGEFTFSDATITDPSGTAFNLEGGTATVTYIGKITQGNNAAAVAISGEHDGVVSFEEATEDEGVIAATNGTGLQFDNADGSYNFRDAVTLNGGDAGIDILNDSEGLFSFSDATITDPTGPAFSLDSGTASVLYTGKITQGNSAAAVEVSGEHTGTITFQEATEDEGIVEATNGMGLLFDNADGVYQFTHAVTLGGGDAGIDIFNDSGGSFTFSDATITDPTGAAFDVDGGTASVTFTGKITQSNNAAAVAVYGEHAGTITFQEATEDEGVVEATNGTGLQFDNADGTYRFNDAVTLGGGDAGIDVLNDSEGAFTFSNATITDPTGTAFNVDGGTASATFTGKITQNNNAAAVAISGEHTGTVTFQEATADEGVVEATNGTGLQFDNADGTYRFNDAVTLGGGDAGIDILNDSEGAFTFSNATITDPTGTAFNVDGGTASASFTGKITQGNNAAAVAISGEHDGAITFEEATADEGVIEATDGTGLQFDNAHGTYSFRDAVTLGGGDAGIDILNDSEGLFSFSDATITNPTGAAFNLNGGTATVTYTGKITQNNNVAAVSISGGHEIGTVTFQEATADEGVVEATNGTGLQFDNADGTYRFNDAVTLGGGDAGIDILNDSGGTFTFSDATITNPTGVAFNLEGGTANVSFTGQITQNFNASAVVNIEGEHTGTVNFNEAESDAGVVIAGIGSGLQFDQADGTYNFNDASDLIGGAGIDIQDSEGAFSFANDSRITSPSGTAFTVNASAATVTYNGTITSNGGRPVELTNNTGGIVTFGRSFDGNDEGILVQNNTGGIFRFNGLLDLDTGANDAVSILGNADDVTTRFANLDIETTSGDGLTADGGILEVTGSSNTISTDTGVAVNLTDVVIGTSGASFESISVDGAASNGMVLNGVTGSTFTVGSGGSNPGDGGVIQNTTGAGILITNTARVSLNNMQVSSTGGDGISLVHNDAASFNVTIADCTVNNTTNDGISLNASGTGSMWLTLDGNQITQSNAQQAVALTIGAGTVNTNVTLTDNSVTNDLAVAGANQEAFLMTVGGGTCTFQADGNTFTSNDTDATFDVQVNAGKLDAYEAGVIRENSFTNGDTTASSRGYRMWAKNTSTINLRLLDNTAAAASGEMPFLLERDPGAAFGVALLNPQPDAGGFTAQNVNQRNGGTGAYADYDTGWVIEFLPDPAPPTPPIGLGFTHLDEP